MKYSIVGFWWHSSSVATLFIFSDIVGVFALICTVFGLIQK
jgi:hypothetical protein